MRLFPVLQASSPVLWLLAGGGGPSPPCGPPWPLWSSTTSSGVLAYSTISQVGYMFLAVGASDIVAGMFHLLSHAFFKSLLFLAAGCVIKALDEEHNIYKMGNLPPPAAPGRGPVPYWRPVPERLPPAGRLLQQGPHPAVHLHCPGAFLQAVLGGRLPGRPCSPRFTPFGPISSPSARGPMAAPPDQVGHAAPPAHLGAVAPGPRRLWATACSTYPWGRASTGWAKFMGSVPGAHMEVAASLATEVGMALASAAGVLAAIILAARLYWGAQSEPGPSPWRQALFHAFYLDRFYELALVRPYRATAAFLWKQFDQNGLDLGFLTLSQGLSIFSRGLAGWSSGRLSLYLLMVAAALTSVLGLLAWSWVRVVRMRRPMLAVPLLSLLILLPLAGSLVTLACARRPRTARAPGPADRPGGTDPYREPPLSGRASPAGQGGLALMGEPGLAACPGHPLHPGPGRGESFVGPVDRPALGAAVCAGLLAADN